MHVIILIIKLPILQTILLTLLTGEIFDCFISIHIYSMFTWKITYLYSTLLFFLSIASVLSKAVLQTPPDLLENLEDTAVLHCSHNVSDYNRILWYKMSSSGSEMKHLGYLLLETPNPEEPRYKLSGDGRSKGSLSIPSLTLQDSAVYFCAAYTHSASLLLWPQCRNLSSHSTLKRRHFMNMKKRGKGFVWVITPTPFTDCIRNVINIINH